MSSGQSLREFICKRLSAAAAEICSEFEETIVRYEKEIARQRRLLDLSWNPKINLHRIELPLHYIRKEEEILTDQQLWNQERSSSLDLEEPEPLQEGLEPPQMKVEQDEPELLQILEQDKLCISQDEDQLVLKQEMVASLVTPPEEERDHDDPQPISNQLLFSGFPEAETGATAPQASTGNFFSREEKKANFMATVVPKVKPRQTVLSDRPLPDAPALPSSLPAPKRPQVQYEQPRHVAGKRRGEKRRLNFEEPEPAAGLSKRPIRPMPPSAASCVPPAVSAAPVLLVVPVQPQAPSIRFAGPSCSQVFLPVKPPPAPVVKPVMPNKSRRPCAACHIPQCGGKKKRYTPSKEKTAGSSQKIFTYCPTTDKSTTSGFDAVYHSFEHFKSVVDQELEKRKKN